MSDQVQASWDQVMGAYHNCEHPPETMVLSAEAFRYMAEKTPNDPRYAEFMEFAANCPPGHAIMMTAETIQYWSGE